MKALFLSPHLDDAVFSAGNMILNLVDAGYEVEVITYFTKSFLDPEGFALACQLDKGLDTSVDYMLWRRREDERSNRLLGASVVHLNLPEAPHRGYENADMLFAERLPTDDLDRELDEIGQTLLDDDTVSLVFLPAGIGNHVDHHQVRDSVERLRFQYPERDFFIWYDQPYLMNAKTVPEHEFCGTNCTDLLDYLPSRVFALDGAAYQSRKMKGCAAYETQIPFQFGSTRGMEQQFGDYPLEYFERLI